MNRRIFLYLVMFIIFFILDRFFFMRVTFGILFFLGLLILFLLIISDYWFLALARDSSVRIGVYSSSGLKNFTTIGPPEMRVLARIGKIYNSNNEIAYPSVVILPRGGLSSEFFLPLRGGGKKGYDIVPEAGLIEFENGGHQLILFQPHRVSFESLPIEWKLELEKDKKFVPNAPIYFYYGIENFKKIRIPSQLLELTDEKMGEFDAMIRLEAERAHQLMEENKVLRSRLISAYRLQELKSKHGFAEKLKDLMMGGEEDESEKYEPK